MTENPLLKMLVFFNSKKLNQFKGIRNIIFYQHNLYTLSGLKYNEEKELQDIIMEFRKDPMGFARDTLNRAVDLELELVSLLYEAKEDKAAVVKTEVVCNDSRWEVWNVSSDPNPYGP